MTRIITDFNTCSKQIAHFAQLLAVDLKGPLIIAALVTALMAWWMLSSGRFNHEPTSSTALDQAVAYSTS